ncbi:MAG: NTP transferase domain-containing protein [Pseudonocardia sp.]
MSDQLRIPPQVVILAAGMGTRLGMPMPKPLTPLADGRSILGRQLDHLRAAFGADVRVTVVVGFRPDMVMAAAPDVTFVYNERYEHTNTCKSLLKALRASHPGGVLWLNGDVVFDPGLLPAITGRIGADRTFVCVNTERVGAEEVKYTLDPDGFVDALSKQVVGGLGEAVGINYIAAADKAVLLRQLEACRDQDYFERGLEAAIAADGLRVEAVDISAHFAIEVDFADDLARANTEVSRTVTPAA